MSAVFTFFFSMFRAFFSMTMRTCFKTSDCPQVVKFPSDPGADPTSGLIDRTVPFAFITEGICGQIWKVCIWGDEEMSAQMQSTASTQQFVIPLPQCPWWISKNWNVVDVFTYSMIMTRHLLPQKREISCTLYTMMQVIQWHHHT